MARAHTNGNGTRRRRCPAGCGKLLTARGLQRHLNARHPDYGTDPEIDDGEIEEVELRIAVLWGNKIVFSQRVDRGEAVKVAQDLAASQVDWAIANL